MPATAATSATGSATGSASRSTRHRRSGMAGRGHSGTGVPLPSNPGSTCPAGAVSGSRTPWWCGGPPGPVPTPRRRDHTRCSRRQPGIFSSCNGAGPPRWRHNAVATTNDLKNGMTLNIDGQLWNVVDFQHVKPGKGGAFVRTKLKNVMSGKVVDRTFNAGVRVEQASVDRREMQYLYREGDDFVFMDTETYDQPHIPEATVGDAANYLLEEQNATVAFNEGVPLYVELPAAVELTVSQTDPGLQGDRSTGGTKPATLETGAQIHVPLFITTGEKIRVDTRTGQYLGRACGGQAGPGRAMAAR